MDAKGFVVPPGGSSVLSMAPGRSAALKLLGGEAGDSIMLFEETAPAGTDTTFHLHRDSDEVAYVLSGEITFKIGEEVTVCVFRSIVITDSSGRRSSNPGEGDHGFRSKAITHSSDRDQHGMTG